MSWEEHAAAPAACFQGKALALPPGPAKPAAPTPACGPSVQPAGEARHPQSPVSTRAPSQSPWPQPCMQVSLSWAAGVSMRINTRKPNLAVPPFWSLEILPAPTPLFLKNRGRPATGVHLPHCAASHLPSLPGIQMVLGTNYQVIYQEATHCHSSRRRLRSSATRAQILALHVLLSNTGQVP